LCLCFNWENSNYFVFHRDIKRMTAVEVQILLPNGVSDTMIFAAGSQGDEVEEKIRHAVNLIGGTLEYNGITCMRGHVLDVNGKYTFNRGIPKRKLLT
jgi:hypothetical protein